LDVKNIEHHWRCSKPLPLYEKGFKLKSMESFATWRTQDHTRGKEPSVEMAGKVWIDRLIDALFLLLLFLW
jgi:hypothetical protein